MAPESGIKTYPLYSTTYTLHRLSPLYTGSSTPLSNTTLLPYAQNLREILTGEVLRGVRVGLGSEEEPLARVGALQNVTWRILQEELAWEAKEQDEVGEDTTMGLGSGRGIIVTITYEKMEYKAVMLRGDKRDPDTTIASVQEDEGFEHFPLLMLKMPGSLRETFVGFLETTFDTRVSGVHLSSKYLMGAFEQYIVDLSFGGNDETMNLPQRVRILRNTIKETVIYVGFDLPSGSGSLKTIDIQIAREDLPQMVEVGKKIGKSPLFDALTSYVKQHMALDLRHERVAIVRIANGAFVLGGEGKVKITQPVRDEDGDSPQGRATRRLLNGLVEVATGGSLAAGAKKT